MKKKAIIKNSPLKLKDIIQQVWWDEVAIELVSMHPDLRPKLAGYQEVLEQLKKLDPVISDDQVVVEFDEWSYDDPGPYFSAYGRNVLNGEEETLAFTPWAECLGMTVVQKPFDKMPQPRIAAVCLYEMTVHGFTEEKIQEEKLTIIKEIEKTLKKRKITEDEDWREPLEPSMKDSLRRLRKWLRWGGIAREYFGENGCWFVEHFINDQAPEYFDELDRCTLKAALKEISRDLLWVAGAL